MPKFKVGDIIKHNKYSHIKRKIIEVNLHSYLLYNLNEDCSYDYDTRNIDKDFSIYGNEKYLAVVVYHNHTKVMSELFSSEEEAKEYAQTMTSIKKAYVLKVISSCEPKLEWVDEH